MKRSYSLAECQGHEIQTSNVHLPGCCGSHCFAVPPLLAETVARESVISFAPRSKRKQCEPQQPGR